MGKIAFAKRHVVVVFVCAVFLLVNLGAVGSRGRRRAKEAVCAANLKQWGVIFRTLATDNGGFFMDRSDVLSWPKTLALYYRNPRMLLCPEAVKTYVEGGINPFMAWDHHADDLYYYKGSYVLNLWILRSDYDECWKTPFVTNAGDAPMFLDGQ